MDSGLLIVLVIGFGIFAVQNGWLNFGLPTLPPGTAVGTILQQPNGSYAQAVQGPNGQIIAQPITPAQAQQFSITGAVTAAGGAAAGISASVSAGSFGFTGVAAGLGTASLIGAAALAIYEICRLIFKGADPNQVPASKIEQVYECFADIMLQLYRAGLVSQNAAISMMQSAISGAQQAELNAPQYAKDARPFNNGIKNAVSVINAEISTTQTIRPIPLQPLTLAGARALYVGAYPSPGWYASSVQLAYQIADSAVQNLISNGTQ